MFSVWSEISSRLAHCATPQTICSMWRWSLPTSTGKYVWRIEGFAIPTFIPLLGSIFYCYGCTKLETPVTVRTLKLALCRETIQGLDVDAVATNTVKSRKWRNGASSRCFWGQQIVFTYRTEDLSHSRFSINYGIDYFFAVAQIVTQLYCDLSKAKLKWNLFNICTKKVFYCLAVGLLICLTPSHLNIFLP